MKILIAYSSKSGTARECAEELAKKLYPKTPTLADLDENFPDMTDYELVIIGGYVRMGKISKNMVRYVKENADILQETMHAFFICCGLPESTECYFDRSIPRNLLDSSISNMCFGGDLRIKQQKGFDKIWAKMILSSIKSNNIAENMNEEIAIPAIVPENISRFADEIRHCF